jgi:hypothetical protein
MSINVVQTIRRTVMRTTFRAAGVAVASIVVTAGFAAPAQAASWVYNSSWGHYEQCAIQGQAGVANHTWLDYFCLTVQPDTIGVGRYDLQVLLP